MKKLALLICFITTVLFLPTGCKSTATPIYITKAEKKVFDQKKGNPVKIDDAKTEYEITIIDPGFNSWLIGFARPPHYHSQSYMESRNNIYVSQWNSRVLLPGQYDSSLYEMQIDYSPNTDYGYDVNYKLYNYFIYFQRKYNQRLGHFIPRL